MKKILEALKHSLYDMFMMVMSMLLACASVVIILLFIVILLKEPIVGIFLIIFTIFLAKFLKHYNK